MKINDPAIAIELMKVNIQGQITHNDYGRITSLSTLYYKMFTGEGLDTLLQQVTSTETEAEFKLRKKLTKSICPPVLKSTQMPFYKVVRKQPLIRKIDFDATGFEKRKAELETNYSTFAGVNNLDEFLEQAIIRYNYIDPNAWLIVEYTANDERSKPKPYPYIVTSDRAVNYSIVNNITEWLIVKNSEKKYTGYFGNFAIVMTRNDNEWVSTEINIKTPKDGDLQPACFRFGYIEDDITEGRTFVSVFHSALPYLEKTLKINSELDMSAAMVAFPQRFAFVPRCSHDGCIRGNMPDGSTCPVCHGTGKAQAHTGTQQIVELDMPDHKEDMIDLNNLLVYKGPPIELLKFQQEYIDQLKEAVSRVVFNSEMFIKPTFADTATAKNLESENMNDSLYPFARQYSRMWEFVMGWIAVFTQNEDKIILQHKFPSDFKFKGLTELMADLKAAYDSRASVATISAIEDDINEILYSDRPDELKRIRTQQRFNPFRGYKDEQIMQILAQDHTLGDHKIFWTNQAAIWNELERENVSPWIYDLTEELINTKITEKIANYRERIEAARPAPIASFNPFNDDEEPEV